jgi:chromosome segregation ATPase
MADDPSESGVIEYSRRLLVARGERLFFPAFVVGSAGIWLLYYAGFRQWIVTAFPVSLMLLYMGYELHSGRYAYREDRLGDDLYYLGLLFTLVSLVHALYEFGGANAVQGIVSNFGIALLTTITGLALRVWLYEWRGDALGEPELRARIDLAEAADRLKVQLSACTEDMNGFRLQLAQALGDMVTNASDSVAKAIQEALSELRDRASAVKDAAEKALGGLPGYLVKLNEESARLAVEIEGLWKRVAGVQVPADLLERELAPTIKLLARHARVVEKLTNSEEEKSRKLSEALLTLGTLTEQLGRRTGGIEGAAKALGEFAGQLQSVRNEINGVAVALDQAKRQLVEGAGETAHALQTLASESAAGLEATKTNRKALESELIKSRETLTKVQDALLSMTSLIIHRLGNSGPRTEESGV